MDHSSPATRVATPIPGEKLKVSEQVSSSSTAVVAELPREDNVLADASTARKLALMALFSAAQFLDVFNNRYVHTFCEDPLIAHAPRVLRTARYFLRFPTSPRSYRSPLQRRCG